MLISILEADCNTPARLIIDYWSAGRLSINVIRSPLQF